MYRKIPDALHGVSDISDRRQFHILAVGIAANLVEAFPENGFWHLGALGALLPHILKGLGEDGDGPLVDIPGPLVIRVRGDLGQGQFFQFDLLGAFADVGGQAVVELGLDILG